MDIQRYCTLQRRAVFPKGSKVSFTLDGAQNYTGKALASYNSGELTVSARPAEIVLNYESIILAKAGTEKGISVRVKDSEGNYMEGVTVDVWKYIDCYTDFRFRSHG